MKVKLDSREAQRFKETLIAISQLQQQIAELRMQLNSGYETLQLVWENAYRRALLEENAGAAVGVSVPACVENGNIILKIDEDMYLRLE